MDGTEELKEVRGSWANASVADTVILTYYLPRFSPFHQCGSAKKRDELGGGRGRLTNDNFGCQNP